LRILLTISNSFDFNKENGGISFKDCRDRWGDKLMLKDFAIWCAESFGKSIFYLLEKYTNALAF